MTTAMTVREQTQAIQDALAERADQLAMLLPRHASVERFQRLVIQSVIKNPDLLRASKASLITAAFEAARLGLEPSGAIGGAHLVRYGSSAQLIVDYRGLVELARRSGEIESLSAEVVREGDHFAYQLGTEPEIEHRPGDSRGEITHAYAIAWLKGGRKQFAVMDREEVDGIRARSAAGNSGPWRTDYGEMAKKTALRRLSKLLPLTVEVREVLDREDELERPQLSTVPASESLSERIAARAKKLTTAAERAALDDADGLPEIPDYVETQTYDRETLVPDELPLSPTPAEPGDVEASPRTPESAS